MSPSPTAPAELDSNPRFFDLVGQVRAMRRLKPDPVPLETLRKLLETGVQARRE